MTHITIRPGGIDDVPAALALMDSAARWLVARGRPGQWGTEPQATNPRRIAAFTGSAAAGGLAYYEREGFRATAPFTVDTPRGPWPGQVLETRWEGNR